MADQTGVSFDQVSKAATSMITQGVKPSVRGVISVTGGKTETVSKHLRDFFEKRQAEVLKMADELGSSAIAKLLADEIQTVVDRKTANLQQIIEEQRAQLDEVIELLEEKEKDCLHRNEMAEASAAQAIHDANEKIGKAQERTGKAELEAEEAKAIAEQAQERAEDSITATEKKCELLVSNAKNEADALVEAANRRADKAEQETASLREQVKLLSVEQAKREIEQAQHIQMQEQHDKTLSELANAKTQVVQLSTRNETHAAELARLTGELADAKADSKQLATAQGQLVESQKQISQLQNELTRSERERESLTLALHGKK